MAVPFNNLTRKTRKRVLNKQKVKEGVRMLRYIMNRILSALCTLLYYQY